MSYARRGPDSDVYVYCTGRGWECCDCSLALGGWVTFTNTSIDMVEHMVQHIRNGDTVPMYCIEGLIEDALERERAKNI